MRRIILITLLFTILTSTFCFGGNNPPEDIDFQWYKKHYDFIVFEDTFYTYEGEFVIPEGFHRPDSASLTPFQYWVSHFPIWHATKSVGGWGGWKKYEFREICRAVHLPWQSRFFKDCSIILRMAAEYLRLNHREYDLKVIPQKGGELLTYEKWLGGKPLYDSHKVLSFLITESRDSSVYEFYKYLKLCMKNTNYQSLVKNCDTLPVSELAPGDLYIGYNEKDNDGFTYIIMNLFVNDNGEKIYTIATGCPHACDFHMPLVNDDKNNPWLTVQQITDYVTETDFSGFFRLKIK